MNIALVVNPVSGGGKGRKMGEAIAREFTAQSLHHTLIRENSVASTLESFKRISEKIAFTHIMSVGGDGLAHLLFPFAIDLDIPIFVAPAGTGNDFARSTGSFGLTPAKMVQTLINRQPVFIDMGLISHGEKSFWFGQVLSTGFDSLVNERANSYRFFKGKMKYIVATARELPFFVPRTYVLKIDNVEIETGAMLVAIANGKSYGGGMKVCPSADQQDGLFDVLILKPIPVREFIRVFPKVFSGKHVSHPAVEIRRGSSISISSKAIAYADGERIGNLPISVEIKPHVMRTWIL